jgi:hypothetical protein
VSGYLIVLLQCPPLSDSESHVNFILAEECNVRAQKRAPSNHRTQVLLSEPTLHGN